MVEGGGCSGFQYAFSMERGGIQTDDFIFEAEEGVRVISDEVTLEMISGSKILYAEEMIRSSFEVVDNPMADGGCSCGVSFSPKGV